MPDIPSSATLRDLVSRHRTDGLPTVRALAHPFFDMSMDEARALPRRDLIRDLRLLPKVGEKSFRIILKALELA